MRSVLLAGLCLASVTAIAAESVAAHAPAAILNAKTLVCPVTGLAVTDKSPTVEVTISEGGTSRTLLIAVADEASRKTVLAADAAAKARFVEAASSGMQVKEGKLVPAAKAQPGMMRDERKQPGMMRDPKQQPGMQEEKKHSGM